MEIKVLILVIRVLPPSIDERERFGNDEFDEVELAIAYRQV
jgi:hypothetical protein